MNIVFMLYKPFVHDTETHTEASKDSGHHIVVHDPCQHQVLTRYSSNGLPVKAGDSRMNAGYYDLLQDSKPSFIVRICLATHLYTL